MELYTLQRKLVTNQSDGSTKIKFLRKDSIEEFSSLIWTERFLGNGDVQIVCPATKENALKLPKGAFLGLDQSNELMKIMSVKSKDGSLTIGGISVLPWLNHRFIRNSKAHKVRSWLIQQKTPSEILWLLLQNAINHNNALIQSNTDILSNYLNMLKIPEIGLHSLDISGQPINVSVEFGNAYDVMVQVAQQYNMGMQIRLLPDNELTALGFRTYKGLDRTSSQDPAAPSKNNVVTFSKATDSLVGIEELYSSLDAKTICFAFGSNLDADLGLEHGSHNSGIAWVKGMDENNPEAGGLNCQALQLFIDDLSGYPDPLSTVDINNLMGLLNIYAAKALQGMAPIAAVDGQIVSADTYVYGEDYYLGDLVEIEGESGQISVGQVIEYIRAKDNTGEQGYPTISMIESINTVTTRFDLGPGPHKPYDDAGDAFQLVGNKGHVLGTNVDCTTDGQNANTNTDWLTFILGSPFKDLGSSDPDSNYHTVWYKWAVPQGWSSTSRLKVWLSDYNSHMILFLLTPFNKFNGQVISPPVIPSPGSPPSKVHQDKIYAHDIDITEDGVDPPYETIFGWVQGDIWAGNTNYTNWVYVGIGAPPLGQWGQTQDRGGDFRLHWQYWSDYSTAKKPV